jgi:hypothetical protein
MVARTPGGCAMQHLTSGFYSSVSAIVDFPCARHGAEQNLIRLFIYRRRGNRSLDVRLAGSPGSGGGSLFMAHGATAAGFEPQRLQFELQVK